MDKYAVLLTAKGNISVDVSDFAEACLAVAGYHMQKDTMIQDWQGLSGLVVDIAHDCVVGKVDYSCNFWLGQVQFKNELPFYAMLEQQYNYIFH